MDNSMASSTGNNVGYSGAPATHVLPVTEENGLVNLNHVIQQLLQALAKEVKALQAIIRFDLLPFVKGNGTELYEVFENLFTSIINHPPAGNKLFIYIRCEKARSETMDLRLPEGFCLYTICVYTNIKVDEAWLHQHQQVRARKLIQQMMGNLITHPITNTGCLYELELPGKN
jgi:light-regulated signal transduction histidine kinase (bacteriophytochrome)